MPFEGYSYLRNEKRFPCQARVLLDNTFKPSFFPVRDAPLSSAFARPPTDRV